MITIALSILTTVVITAILLTAYVGIYIYIFGTTNKAIRNGVYTPRKYKTPKS